MNERQRVSKSNGNLATTRRKDNLGRMAPFHEPSLRNDLCSRTRLSPPLYLLCGTLFVQLTATNGFDQRKNDIHERYDRNLGRSFSWASLVASKQRDEWLHKVQESHITPVEELRSIKKIATRVCITLGFMLFYLVTELLKSI
jgi:hypothetical protein